MQFIDYRGLTALVTGASSGIGAVFGRQLAARGANLVLVARNEAALTALAQELSRTHPVEASVIALDLARHDAGSELADRLEAAGQQVDVLVNNAGFATYGDVATSDAGVLHEEIMLNCLTLADLSRQLLPGMVQRQRGVIVNVASTAAFQPTPHMAVYGATKAFVLSFSEALWAEARPHGVRVLGLCPGATDTPFFDRVGAAEASVGKKMPPERVVELALRAIDHGKPSLVTGRSNAALAKAPRLVSRRQTIKITERTLRPQTARTAATSGTAPS